MKPGNKGISSPKHLIFVNEMVAHGNRRIAYQAAYPAASASTARINACKLMKYANIIQAIAEGKEALSLKMKLAPVELRRMQRITKMRKVLDGIVDGSIMSQTVVTNKAGKIKYIKNSVDVQAIVRAIKVYDKLDGDNSVIC